MLAGGHDASVLATSEIYALRVDIDLDGMDDEWELKFAFNPADRVDAALDADMDGLKNSGKIHSSLMKGLLSRS